MSQIQQIKSEINVAQREIDAAAAMLKVEPLAKDAQAQIVGCLAIRLAEVRELLVELNTRVHSGYDFNADPDAMTRRVGRVLKP